MQLYKCISKYGFGVALLLIAQSSDAANRRTNPAPNVLTTQTSHEKKRRTKKSYQESLFDLSRPLRYGETPYPTEELGAELHEATIDRDTKTLTMFLQLFKEYALEFKTTYGNNCLHLSARTGSIKSLDLILEEAKYIYDKSSEAYTQFIHAKNSRGNTALELAIEKGNFEAVRKLAENIDSTTTKSACNLAYDKSSLFSMVNPGLAKKYRAIVRLLSQKPTPAKSF